MSLDPSARDDPPPRKRSKSSSFANGGLSVTPRRGQLFALDTKAEIENRDIQTIFAYVVEIPQNFANKVLKYVERHFGAF